MPGDPTTSPSSHSVERLLTYYQIRKGDFMVKIDLKDAYFTVPIRKKHQTVLRFLWEETVYEFACLPFVGLLRQLHGHQTDCLFIRHANNGESSQPPSPLKPKRGVGLVEGQPGSMERESTRFGFSRLYNRDGRFGSCSF